MPYKFNGKQLDDETGLYYYGARYMNPVASIWYGVDPEFDATISFGSYAICKQNPIINLDLDGRKPKLTYQRREVGGVIYINGRVSGERPLEAVSPEFDLLIGTQQSFVAASKKILNLTKKLPQSFKIVVDKIKNGGPTFEQYKQNYWATHTKRKLPDLISRKSGKVWRQNDELHHRFIPQRAKWAPNWLKNNRFNIKRVTSLKHAKVDPYRARFAPKWVKKEYNLKVK